MGGRSSSSSSSSKFRCQNSFAILITLVLFTMMNESSVVLVAARIAIFSGQSLTAGQYLENTPGGSYRLVMQTDCNLVLYINLNKVLWNSETGGKGKDCSANLLTTGNLVVLNGNGYRLYESGSAGAVNNYVLVVQGDGNVVTYPKAVWNTQTYQF